MRPQLDDHSQDLMLVRKPTVESLNSGCFDPDRHPQIERVSPVINFLARSSMCFTKNMQEIVRSKWLVSTELEIKN